MQLIEESGWLSPEIILTPWIPLCFGNKSVVTGPDGIRETTRNYLIMEISQL